MKSYLSVKYMLSAVVVLLLSAPEKTCAQAVEAAQGYNSLRVGAMVARSTIREDAIGLAPFQGVTMGAGLGYERRLESYDLAFEAFGLTGTILPAKGNDVSAKMGYLRGDLSILRVLISGDRFRASAGLGLGASMGKRTWSGLLNVFGSSDWSAFASLAGECSYVLQEGDNGWVLGDKLVLPVLSVSKQSLDALGTALPPLGTSSTSPQWKGIGGFLYVYNRVYLRHAFGIRHALALEYAWNYQSMGGSSSYLRADHVLGVHYSFQF